DDAVRRARAVEGRRRGTLDHLDTLDIGRVDIGETGAEEDAVDYVEWLLATPFRVDRCRSAQDHLRRRARAAADRGDVRARDPALQLTQRAARRDRHLTGIDAGDGEGDLRPLRGSATHPGDHQLSERDCRQLQTEV